MRKVYKEAMDEVYLPQELREKILQNAASTNIVKRKNYMCKQLQIVLSCIVLCVITGFIWYTVREDQHKEYREEKVKIKHSSDYKGYKGIERTPESYDMAITGRAKSFHATLPIDLFEGKTLPIYEFHETNDLVEVKALANTLKVDWDDAMLVGANDDYQMEANAYGYYNVEDTQAYVDVSIDELYDKYRIYLPLDNPIQECDEQGCVVYDANEQEEQMYLNKALFCFQFHVSKTMDEETYRVSFKGLDKSRLQLVKEVNIMTQKEAEEALLAGRYYTSSNKPASFVKEDIQNVSLMYSELGRMYATFPYMLPKYQFIVRTDGMDYICNVVALKQEDLKELKHIDWNFQ